METTWVFLVDGVAFLILRRFFLRNRVVLWLIELNLLQQFKYSCCLDFDIGVELDWPLKVKKQD